MFAWLAKLIAGGALSVFGDSFLKPILGAISHGQDVNLEKFKTETGADRDVALSLLNAEIARQAAAKELALTGMSHPIWWFAWALFVLPVGLYHAAIFVVSTFDLAFVVKQVPPTQEQWALWIVTSIFAAQATTGVVTTIANRFAKK